MSSSSAPAQFSVSKSGMRLVRRFGMLRRHVEAASWKPATSQARGTFVIGELDEPAAGPELPHRGSVIGGCPGTWASAGRTGGHARKGHEASSFLGATMSAIGVAVRVHSRMGDDLAVCHVPPPVELGDVLELDQGPILCSGSSMSPRPARTQTSAQDDEGPPIDA